MTPKRQKAQPNHAHAYAHAYAQAFAELSPETLPQLVAMTDPKIVFSDPFNRLKGQAAFRHVFEHMYRTCHQPKFTITDIAHGNDASYIRWRMTTQLKSWPYLNLDITGMSEIHINSTGAITAHIDHWDSASQLLGRIPFTGILIQAMLKKLSCPPTL